MNNQYFITTAIPYINAKLHLGHIQELLLTKQIVQGLTRQNSVVKWQTGTDDNSQKNILAAHQANLSPKSYLIQQIKNFTQLLQQLQLSPDFLVHTSSPHHHQVVKQFLRKIKSPDLEVKHYEGLYCSGCEDFISPHELTNGVCPDHLTTPQTIFEKNVFFKLSNYQTQIKQALISKRVKIYPENKLPEILSFIDQGLKDISISRPSSAGSPLGVDFPDLPGHKVYVWIDALINYLSGVNYFTPAGQNLWDKSIKIHVIGKNVWKFHAIYWLGLLLSAGIELPQEIIIHGFLTVDGEKISKSRGNGGDLDALLAQFSPEVLATFLLGKNYYGQDFDFSQSKLNHFYHDELLGQISNLFPRIFSLSQKNNYSLTRKVNPVSINPRCSQEIYFKLLKICTSLNKDINDSKIWTLPPLAGLPLIRQWEIQLNEVADLLSWWFPTLEPAINNSFQEKIILFKKINID